MSGESARALKAECPVCFSPPSWRCIRGVTANGTDYLSDEPHAARVRAAAERAEKGEKNG